MSEEYKNYVPRVQEYTIPRVIGVKQASKEFGIAEHAIRRWIKSGKLPVIRCGKKHLINCTTFSTFLNEQSSLSNAVAVDENGNYYSGNITKKGKIKPIY